MSNAQCPMSNVQQIPALLSTLGVGNWTLDIESKPMPYTYSTIPYFLVDT
jgi:hypothetical protein